MKPYPILPALGLTIAMTGCGVAAVAEQTRRTEIHLDAEVKSALTQIQESVEHLERRATIVMQDAQLTLLGARSLADDAGGLSAATQTAVATVTSQVVVTTQRAALDATLALLIGAGALGIGIVAMILHAAHLGHHHGHTVPRSTLDTHR